MEPYPGMIMATVERPDDRDDDPIEGRERFWRQGLGPSRWLFVVVDFTESPARIVTAYGQREDPEGW